MTMLFQCFGRNRETGEMLENPVYVNATSVDHAFDILDEMLGHAVQWKSVHVEGYWITWNDVKPPHQRWDAMMDAMSDRKKGLNPNLMGK